MNAKFLLTAIGASELTAGFGLLVAPSLVASLLVGMPLITGAGPVIGRVAGLALVAIGLICWIESANVRAPSSGLLIGLLAYNVSVPVVLLLSLAEHHLGGIALWPTVALHWGLSIWLVSCIRSHRAGRRTPN